MNPFPQAQFLLSAAAPTQFPADRGTEVAFAGRSNAGKSSAINAITGRRSLARTSKTPGQTRLLNFFELAPGRRIVDLPGYGYANVPEPERRKWAPLIGALRNRASLKGLFLIVDGRRGIMPGDLELIDWANPELRRIHILIAKADKLNRREGAQVLQATTEALEAQATVQLFSAVDKTGVADAQRVLDRWLAGEGGIKNPGDLW